ncbi:MAG: response regulator [Pikeienuella sp.]
MTLNAQNAKTVLIVEDDKLNQRLFDDVLTAAGHSTIVVDNCTSAINAAHANKPDLIIMDIRLGAGSGITATRMIKGDFRTDQTPIIAVTANTLTADKTEAMEAGCADYLTKPVSISHLLSVVNRHMPRSAKIMELRFAS